MAIFAWRIIAKFLLHRILPPMYRFLSQLMTLPNRRFYTPATDYKNVPQDKHLRAFPSVLDLPGMVELEVDGVSTAASRRLVLSKRDIKLRSVRGRSEKAAGIAPNGVGLGMSLGLEELGGKDAEVVKHYDADGERRSCESRCPPY